MKRISTSTRVVDKFGAGKDGFTNGNALVGLAATDLESDWFDHVQEAVVRTIEEAGLELSGSDLNQFVTALKTVVEKKVVASSNAGGTASAVTATVASVATALVAGQPVCVMSAAANPGAMTILLTLGTTAIAGMPIVKGNNQPLVVGDVPMAGYPMSMRYCAAMGAMLLLNPATGVGGADAVGQVFDWPVASTPSNAILCNGAALNSVTYSGLFAKMVRSKSGATVSIATPAVVGWAGHGHAAGAPIKFSSTGNLPTGLTAGVTYYVIAAGLSTDTFQLSATVGGAAVNTSGAQAGVHTAINAPHGCANDLSTFNVPNIPADYTTVQAAGNEGTSTVGQVIAHTHNAEYQVTGVGLTGGPTGFGQNGGQTGSTGGSANLAAGVRMRKYIRFA